MSTTFRRATDADAADLATFASRTFTDTYAAHNTPENMRAYLAQAYGVEQQRREIGDPAMVTLLTESDGQLVGYAQLRRASAPPIGAYDRPVEIYRFYVDARAHGTGVAQRLMAEATVEARALGGGHLWLAVWERNPRAIAFYMKSGFRDIGTQHFQLGADRQTDRVLVLDLTS